MLYRKFQELSLSALGLGCMRLPTVGGDESRIDADAVRKMVAYAMEHGINYYDTAWGYHNGQSETVMGEVLSAYPRQSFFLASKFPGYDLSNMDKVSSIFEAQLKKCRVDYFDFYLFHNVCEMNIDAYLDPKYGIFDYLTAQKANGRIRHLGFSCHGDLPTIRRFLEAYGEQMEFCQIQLNWLDWDFQNAREKVALAHSYGLPVWVMEPLRGGKLASLAPAYEEKLRALRPDESIPAWAFRFLQGIDDVCVTLSGMSDFAQLQANIETFSASRPLSPAENAALMEIAQDLRAKNGVPCTACRYCTAHCPQGLDIPHLLALYNEQRSTAGGFSFIAPMVVSTLPKEKRPDACLGCRSCEQVCPQKIKIADALADFRALLK